MRRRFWFGFAPLLGIVCSLAAAPVDAPPSTTTGCADEKKADKKKGGGKRDTWVCPLVIAMDYKTYRTWYAQECVTPPVWCSLDTEAMAAGNCDDCTKLHKCDNCTQVARKKKKGPHYHHPNLEAGKPESDPNDHKFPSGKPDKKALVWVERPDGAKVKVMLYRVTVTPKKKKQDPLTIYSGTQVKTSDTPTSTIMKKDVTKVAGEVWLVKYDSDTYQVVLTKPKKP
jgi:hypothetical protein